MAEMTRTADQREADRAEVARLYLTGSTQAAIAAQLDITQQQVSYDLGVIRKRWRASAARDFDALIDEQLAKVDRVEAEYWAAWERSQREAQASLTRRTEGEGVTTTAEMRREAQVGNPAFLAGVLACVERRCRLLGLDAPTKIAPTSPDGKEGYRGKFTDGERARRVLALLAISETG